MRIRTRAWVAIVTVLAALGLSFTGGLPARAAAATPSGPTALAATLIPATAPAATAIPAATPVSVNASGPHSMALRPHGATGPRPHGATPAVISGPLVNGGGPVQTAPKVYVDFWHWTSDPNGEQSYLGQFLSSAGSSSWLATVGQYGAGWSGQLLAGTWSDPNLVPSNPTDAQIQAEAVVAAKHFGVGNSVNVQIIVATPTGHSTSGFGTSWCGYHGTVAADPDVTFTNLPYMTDAGGSCGEDSVNGSNGTLDGVSIVEGHELAETITDPLLNAWRDASGNEIGDKCAWTDLADLSAAAGTFAVQPLWSNAANGCAQSPASPLTGVLTGGTLLAKAGTLTAAWNQEDSAVSQAAVATDSANGPLIGVVTTSGEAYAAEGLLNTPVDEYSGVQEIAVASDPAHGPLIAVLTTSGEALVKEGGLSAQWVDVESGVSQIAVASDPAHGPLIGVVTTGGEALVKEGGLSAPWDAEESGVSQIAVASDSTDGPAISILTTGGVAYAKEGSLSASWVHEYTGASQIAVASDPVNGPLVGVLTAGGEAVVKEGGLAAAWTNEESGVAQLSLGSDSGNGPLIGVLTSGGVAYAKQGGLSAVWTHEYTGATEVTSAG
jgi:hypothetical protein